MLLRGAVHPSVGRVTCAGKAPSVAAAAVPPLFTQFHLQQSPISEASSYGLRHSARHAPKLPSPSFSPSARGFASTCKASAPASAESAVSTFERGDGWRVHKFGGTCMAAAERIAGASKLMIDIDPEATGKVAIVSAMGSHPTSPLKVGQRCVRLRTRQG